jgi:uncharacterized protein
MLGALAIASALAGGQAAEEAGCGRLGLLYEKGEGVTRDLTRAAALFKRACDGGVAEACQRLEDLGP